ncbi:hypothetical protein C2845_PM16G05330 [Panicum miliaceum]|uniref:Uncharacterized protein n=1 Tax=Panicum miliaceum TaxID=4540 RepID=A0A3L6PUY7_PANMI|nr:hypothetical protein C2845_PM16G05330 [Panicum miliaceum]
MSLCPEALCSTCTMPPTPVRLCKISWCMSASPRGMNQKSCGVSKQARQRHQKIRTHILQPEMKQNLMEDTVEMLRVYWYDVVPRVPFDAPPVAEYTHGGICVYFDGWYKGTAIAAGGDAPNPNYFDPRYLLYGNAWGDLFKGAFLWAKEGKDYRESAVSLLYHAAGLASHSPRDYVNAIRLGSNAAKEA